MRRWAAILLVLALVCGLECLRRRGAAYRLLTTPPELDPDVVYETCPGCDGNGGGCLTCFDHLLVPHNCP